ncbi:MAG TPA: hypothetical protein VFZ53_20140 [Polyangiaceae bacterium]
MNDSTLRVRVGSGLLVSFLAGAGGCSASDEPEWQFDQADMESAVFGTWTGTYTPFDGSEVPLTLQIRSSDEKARSLSCGSRSFSETRGTAGLSVRCYESTTLALSGTLTLGGVSEPQELDGYFEVAGTSFDSGYLDVSQRDALANSLEATYRNGRWSDCRLLASYAVNGSCTLDERVE